MKSPLPATLPPFAVSAGDLDQLGYRDGQRYVAGLEDAGFGMLWLAEVLGREAFTAAQLALAATSRMIVGSGVVRAFERVPKSAAAAQALLSDGFPGRYVLGLGVNASVRDRGQSPVGFMAGYLDQIDGPAPPGRRRPGRRPPPRPPAEASPRTLISAGPAEPPGRASRNVVQARSPRRQPSGMSHGSVTGPAGSSSSIRARATPASTSGGSGPGRAEPTGAPAAGGSPAVRSAG
jgi:hypothetical protein